MPQTAYGRGVFSVEKLEKKYMLDHVGHVCRHRLDASNYANADGAFTVMKSKAYAFTRNQKLPVSLLRQLADAHDVVPVFCTTHDRLSWSA